MFSKRTRGVGHTPCYFLIIMQSLLVGVNRREALDNLANRCIIRALNRAIFHNIPTIYIVRTLIYRLPYVN